MSSEKPIRRRPLSTLEIVTDPQTRSRIYHNYKDSIEFLQNMGFTDLDYYSSAGRIFSALSPMGLRISSIAESNNDMAGIKFPCRIVLYYPLLRHSDYATFASPLNGNFNFSTLFLDGTILVTGNKYARKEEYSDQKFYRYGIREELIEAQDYKVALWKTHQYYIESFRTEGYILNRNLSAEVYRQIVNADENIWLTGSRNGQKK